MNHQLKLILRELSHKSKLFSVIYHKASSIKTSKRMDVPDEEFLKQKFLENTGKVLNLDNPQTFNEKIQWLKLYDHNPLYTTLVDKYAVKQYVSEKIGSEHVIPVVGGPWSNADEIDFDALPDQFVLKCNHDCGSIVICTGKTKLNIPAAKAKLNNSLKRNYYYVGREWPYKNVKPSIFAEKYMVDESGYELKDYKFFCFNGVPKTIQVDFGRYDKHERNLYSIEWEYLGYTSLYPTNPNRKIEKPKKLLEMLHAAGILSTNIPFVRVDFYSIRDEFYFGEMTFYHGGGMEEFKPAEWDKTLGGWIDLSLVKTK